VLLALRRGLCWQGAAGQLRCARCVGGVGEGGGVGIRAAEAELSGTELEQQWMWRPHSLPLRSLCTGTFSYCTLQRRYNGLMTDFATTRRETVAQEIL
jgi:hypothetical protein